MSAQFGWSVLEDTTSSVDEITIQNVFNNWRPNKSGWEIAGAPLWLLTSGGGNSARRVAADGGYNFIPDVLWDEKQFTVVELKRSAKFEEISLVEVLHHAWHLRKRSQDAATPDRFPLPVIVSSYSAWMRGALCYLFEHGLSRTAIRFVEASYFTSPGGTRLMWLYEPFAEWTVTDSLPPCVPDAWRGDQIQWWRVRDSETWIATLRGKSYTRPLTPYPGIFIAGVHGNAEKYVVWIGASTKPFDTYLLADCTNQECKTIPTPMVPPFSNECA